MNNNITWKVLLLPILLLLAASMVGCDDIDTRPKPTNKIIIGEGETSLNEVELKFGESVLIPLSGGKGKYAVKGQDDKIVKAAIEGSTLKLEGVGSGSSEITISSGSSSAKLNVMVLQPSFGIYNAEGKKIETPLIAGFASVIPGKTVLLSEQTVPYSSDNRAVTLTLESLPQANAAVKLKASGDKQLTALLDGKDARVVSMNESSVILECNGLRLVIPLL